MYIRPRGSSILTPYRPEMLKKILFVVSALALARAQVPSLGWCPEYVPMANFDMSKFLGVWYEAERYFQITEVVSRCVMANYTKGPDGKLRVSNEVTNRLTGIKRVLEGEIKASSSKADEGKLHVKYTVPFTPETQYAVLDTDYKSYAVLWSCSGIGPINAQNAWLMTRERQAPGEILQKAYGVLDKYKISKTFFVKTDQEDCAYLATKPSKPAAEKPAAEKPETPSSESTEAPAVEGAAETVEEAQKAKSVVNFRSAIMPDAPAIIIETRKAELAEAAEVAEAAEAVEAVEVAKAAAKPAEEATVAETPAEVQPEAQPEASAADEPKPEIPLVEAVEAEEPAKVEPSVAAKAAVAAPAEIPAPSSVPEVILKTADLAKEMVKQSEEDAKQVPPFAAIANVFTKPQELGAQIQAALADPVEKFQAALADPVEKFQAALADPAGQLQAAFSKPIAQVQEAIAKPLANIQQAFAKPAGNSAAASEAPEAPAAPEAPEKPEAPAEAPGQLKEIIEQPMEIIKEELSAPAAEAAPEKMPEEMKEAAPLEAEEKKEEAKKIES